MVKLADSIDWENLGCTQLLVTICQSALTSCTKLTATPRMAMCDLTALGMQSCSVEMITQVKYTWKDGEWDAGDFIRSNQIALDVANTALNYGQSVFEGLKAFRSKDDSVRIFRPKDNAARICHSAHMASMPSIPEHVFLDAVHRCVKENLEFVPQVASSSPDPIIIPLMFAMHRPYKPIGAGGALYIRPLLFGSGPSLILAGPTEYTFIVWATPAGSLYGAGKGPVKGIKAIVLEDFDRAAPKGVGTAKLAGNYAPVFQHMAAAKKQGYGITLHLDSKSRTHIDEFSTSNCLFILQDGENTTLTVPQSSSILESVTTKALCAIAQSTFGWSIDQRPVAFEEVKQGAFVECAAVGTAAALTPIASISYLEEGGEVKEITLGAGGAGPLFTKMLSELLSLQCGDIKDTFGFCWPEGGIK